MTLDRRRAPGDVVVGVTTSGRSENVVRGLAAARAVGTTTVLLSGGDGRPTYCST